ncbi:MAG: radical SAM protein [Schlesneria sp.]
MNWPQITDADVLAVRPRKNPLDPWKPYAFLVEPERSSAGSIDDVMTIFLTNRECPFRCTMCDLWRNTLDDRVPVGAIPAQIDYACERLPLANHLKLYNAGNFFDPQAIPREDYAEIARRVRAFKTVIVENHPRFTNESCIRFRDLIETNLEIAIGLETIHPAILAGLNKRMTVEDFNKAAQMLIKNQIAVRTFLLLKPPGLDEESGIDWAFRSIKHAVEIGVGCISMIPTRSGNGLMERLEADGKFSPPRIQSMERILEQGLKYVQTTSPTTRVFMDVWDAARFFDCQKCGPARIDRIQRMNHSQQIEPAIECHCGQSLLVDTGNQ